MLLKTIILLVFTLAFVQPSWALSITSPQEGAEVYAGAKLQVIVKPAPGEKWEKVILVIFPMSYNPLTNQYKEDIEIPKNVSGNISFDVLAVDKSGNEIELKRTLFVKFPPNVVLQSIVASHAGDDFVSLRKMPPDSNPVEVERYETRQLSVHGRYSDNVNRELTPSSSGTTYTSSNEQVVTVSAEGKLTAKGIGRAKITVRNGQYSAVVDVVVKPYKK